MSNLKVPVTPADHILGDADAAVTLVEYGDFSAPIAAPRNRRSSKSCRTTATGCVSCSGISR